MKYWLMKSEPDVFSIDDLKRKKTSCWEGVRNYQARNFMRDEMRVGDQVLFYHSNAKPSGVAGLARVCREAYPDYFAWDPASPYFDAKASPQNPIWQMVDVAFVEKFSRIVSLDDLRAEPELQDMLVLRRGQRLSIQPVSASHFREVVRLGRGA